MRGRARETYLNDKVGPCGNLQTRMYGVSSAVSENAMRCVTWKKLAMDRKSFKLFPFFSFCTCEYVHVLYYDEICDMLIISV